MRRRDWIFGLAVLCVAVCCLVRGGAEASAALPSPRQQQGAQVEKISEEPEADDFSDVFVEPDPFDDNNGSAALDFLKAEAAETEASLAKVAGEEGACSAETCGEEAERAKNAERSEEEEEQSSSDEARKENDSEESGEEQALRGKANGLKDHPFESVPLEGEEGGSVVARPSKNSKLAKLQRTAKGHVLKTVELRTIRLATGDVLDGKQLKAALEKEARRKRRRKKIALDRLKEKQREKFDASVELAETEASHKRVNKTLRRILIFLENHF